MTKLIFTIVLALNSFAMAAGCDSSSMNYVLKGEHCSYFRSETIDREYDSRNVFVKYFEHKLDMDSVEINSYAGDSDPDGDPFLSMVIKDANQSIHIRYSIGSNGANYDIDEHSVCVVRSCSVIQRN